MVDLTKLKEDRDVVEPFIERLMQRLRERHPDISLDDVSLNIEVRLPVRSANFIRTLQDMTKEGVVV